MLKQVSIVVQFSGAFLMFATSSPSTARCGLSRAAISSAILAAAVLLWGGYTGHWSWTGLSDNDTLWDWLKLLVLPLSLAALPLWLQSHHRMSATRRGTLAGVAVAFGTFVLLGYALHWAWTGFAGNTLWDWLELLLLPVVIATVKFWTAERTMETRHWIRVAAIIAGFVIFAASAYLLPINWSGFVGNTLWDWIKLLFIPILMPLVLVPAVTEWINGGIEEADEADHTENDDADAPAPTTADAAATSAAHRPAVPAARFDSGPHGFSPTSYEIWLSPTEKITAEVRPPADPADSPQLIVNGAMTVHRLMTTTNQR